MRRGLGDGETAEERRSRAECGVRHRLLDLQEACVVSDGRAEREDQVQKVNVRADQRAGASAATGHPLRKPQASLSGETEQCPNAPSEGSHRRAITRPSAQVRRPMGLLRY